jgi:hypothetical protein
VNFLAGQPTAQDDAVEPGLVRRDVITALHERSERVVAGLDLILLL